ncbi:LOW QUALITY PROTEIN: hypothetical protein MXB_688 [Myxobolus squamalis]|nr:LOW QUALITY PROTEIN: hypothetical protein MXB_688 [Myxobolus squamalis]
MEAWKESYNAQLEHFYFLIGSYFPKPYYNKIFDLKNPSDSKLNDMIDLHLYQLSNLEEIKENFRNKQIFKDLEIYVKKVIMFSQNPYQCKNADIILCDFNIGCGFENSLFLPLTYTCNDQNFGEIKKSRITVIHNRDKHPNYPYTPLTFPSQIYERLKIFSENPFIWWIGQLTKYVMRFTPLTMEFLRSKKPFDQIVVG